MWIRACSFEEILPVWSEKLWPGRNSKIENISWLSPKLEIDEKIPDLCLKHPPQFWLLVSENEILGCASLHRTKRNEGRLRGLWVDEKLRGQGFGKKLVEHVSTEAKRQGLRRLWGLTRESQSPFYDRLGFSGSRPTSAFEFGPHRISTKEIPQAFSIFSIFSRFGN